MKETTNITIEPQDVQQALKDFLVKHRPHLKGVDTLVFKTNDDGSYEVRVESSSTASPPDATSRAVKEAKGKGGQVSLPTVTLASQEPSKSVFGGPEELPKGATALPYPPQPASPVPALFARSEEPAITADAPPPPPPAKGLLADLTPVSNKT